jgi:hypothetical protein
VIFRKVSKLKTMYDAAAFITPGRNHVMCQISHFSLLIFIGNRQGSAVLSDPVAHLRTLIGKARLRLGQRNDIVGGSQFK